MVLKETDFSQFVLWGDGVWWFTLKELIFNSFYFWGRVWSLVEGTDF